MLDEFASMAESIVAPMLAFLQTKNIGNYVLPEGWSIVLCSNPPEYNRTAREFDAAIMDRVRVMHVEFSGREFLAYATEKNVHKAILEYLQIHKKHIYICEGGKGDLVTTRGWENLSCTLKVYERMGQVVTQELVLQYIKSQEVAHSFYSFYITVGINLPEEILTDILAGKNLQRHLTETEGLKIADKWAILGQLVYGIAESSKVHSAEYENYMSFQKAYEGLNEQQKKLKDVWKFHDILRNRARGRQSFENDTEREIFGSTQAGEKEKELYRRVLKLLEEKKEESAPSGSWAVLSKIKNADNQKVLEAMKECSSVLKTELKGKMAAANEEITNALIFLSRMDTEEGCYVDAFIEKISQEQDILNVLMICKNKEYGNAVCRANAILGKNWK